MSKIIGFVGTRASDLIQYTARTLKMAEKRVLVVDNSDTGEIAFSLSIDITEGIGESRGVFYLGNAKITADVVEQFDVVLVDFGFHLKNEGILACSTLFVITEMYRDCIKRLSRLQLVEGQERIGMIRNVVDCSIDTDRIERGLGKLGVKEWFSQVWSPEDIECAINSQYNDIYRFNRITGEVKTLVLEIVAACDIDKKLAKRFLKVAAGGK